MIHIDHVSIAARNLYEAAYRLREETGLGFYDGGWTESGLASKIFPLGRGAYLQVEGIVDVAAVNDPRRPGLRRFYDAVAAGEHFRGLGLRVDRRDELDDIAARHRSRVWMNPNSGRMRTDGTRIVAAQTPSIGESWGKGMPNWFYFPDITTHPSGQRVVSIPEMTAPDGVAWIELGGTEADVKNWIGPSVELPLRFNRSTPGVHAIAVRSDQGEIVIRRRPLTIAT